MRFHTPPPNGFFMSAFKLLTEKIDSASRLELIETNSMPEITSSPPQNIGKLLLSTLPNANEFTFALNAFTHDQQSA